MADFLTAVVAHASDFDRSDDAPAPRCFKCRKCDRRIVETNMTEDEVIVWHRGLCGTEGRISNGQGNVLGLEPGHAIE